VTPKNYNPISFAISGALLNVVGIPEDFMTVMFGVSRSIGCTAQLVWSRATLMAIERPDSLTLNDLERLTQRSGAN